jgi:hypothetical protein
VNKRQAEALSTRIERESPSTRVTGFRRWRFGQTVCYVIDAEDVRTGYPFIVYDEEDWNERMARVEPA